MGVTGKRHAAHSRFRTNPEGTAFSVLTCGLTWDWVLPGQEKENPSSGELEGFIMEPLVRFELTTVRLQGGCSTTELKRRGE